MGWVPGRPILIAMPTVRLEAVTDEVLAELARVAVTDAAADEVTPPLTEGSGWTPERIEWFQHYHRTRRAGLDGPDREATWAVLVDGEPAGSVRLKRTDEDGVVECGIWLARSARGRGVSVEAMRLVVDEARNAGMRAVCADTSAQNHAAQAAMTRLGFVLSDGAEGRVEGRLTLEQHALFVE